MGLGQITINLGTKPVINQKQILCRKKIFMLTGLKVHLWHIKVYFKDQNIMQKKDLVELNFEGLKNAEI